MVFYSMTESYELPLLLFSRIFLVLCRVGVFFAVGIALLANEARAFVGVKGALRLTSCRMLTVLMTEQDAALQYPPIPSTVKGILLDMDGTLTDSDTLHFESYRETFIKMTPGFNEGNPITREYYDEWMSGNSNPAIVEKLFPDMHKEKQTALWKSKEDVYRKISIKMTPLPGLVVFLERCRRAGLAMILVTNAPRLDAVHTLQVLGLYDSFGETMVIGYECSRAKPHPDPYLEGLSRLGLKAECCVAFEDSVNGVTSSVSAGLYTIGVGHHAHEKLCEAGVGLCVSDFLDSRLSSTLGLGGSE